MPHQPSMSSFVPRSVVRYFKSTPSTPISQQQAHEGGGGRTLRVVAVAEVVLLPVRGAEDPVAEAVDGEDRGGSGETELLLPEDEEARLQRVHEGHPGEVADGEHEAEAVRGDVHSRQNRRLRACVSAGAGVVDYERVYLVVERVHDVEDLEAGGEPHRVGDHFQATATDSLLADHADVDEEPKNEAGPELVERLEVKGADRRVELPANEELENPMSHSASSLLTVRTHIVDGIAAVASECKECARAERCSVACKSLEHRHHN